MLDNHNIKYPSTVLLFIAVMLSLVLSSCATEGTAPTSGPSTTTKPVISTQPSNWPSATVAVFSRGVQSLGNDNESARVSFAEALELSPQMEPAYYNLAKLDFDEKNYEAVDSFQALIQKNNVSSARLNNLLGTSKRIQNDFDSAKKLYLAAILMNPEYTPAILNLAILYDVYQGEIAEAEKYYLLYRKQLEQQGKQDNRINNWITDIQRRLSAKKGGGR